MPYKIVYRRVPGVRVGLVTFSDSKPKHNKAYLKRHHIRVTEVRKKGKDRVIH